MCFSFSKEQLKELGIMGKKRKSVSKSEREAIALKTNNRCGYCGIDLKKGWHLDHIVPFASNAGKCEESNYMASCPQCNMFKQSWSLEQFRSELSMQVERARDYSVNFRFAEKYGQLELTKKPIIFYFEKLNNSKIKESDIIIGVSFRRRGDNQTIQIREKNGDSILVARFCSDGFFHSFYKYSIDYIIINCTKELSCEKI